MADEPKKVIVQATRVDDTMLPQTFSLAYRLYVIQQGGDMKSIADASNNANDLAYQATVKNEEQDGVLADHAVRIAMTETRLDGHEVRITNAEGAIVTLGIRVGTAENDIDYLQSELALAETKINTIQGDYVSRSVVTSQSLASALNVVGSYSVGGVKVVGARVTGFTAATGTALKGTFNADQNYPINTPLSATEIIALRNGLIEARQRIKAHEDALRAHGLID